MANFLVPPPIGRIDALKTQIINAPTIATAKTQINARELGIVAASDNPRQRILDASADLSSMVSEYGGVDILFDAGSQFNWTSKLELIDGVNLIAKGDVTFDLQSAADRMIATQGQSSILGDFVFDSAGFASTAYIEAVGGSEILVDGARFLNTGADLTIAQAKAIRIGTGTSHIRNVTGDGTGHLVDWYGTSDSTANSTGSTQINTRLINPSASSSVCRIYHHLKNLRVYDVVQEPYAANVLGGHCISFQGESPDNPNPTIDGVSISKIRFTGRPGLAWESATPNGATGDMIAIRSAINTSITDFCLQDGGEFGIDDVHGSTNTYIGPGNGIAIIERMDGSGVVIGGNANRDDGAGGQQIVAPARNTRLSNIDVIDCGIDQSIGSPLGYSSISGIRLLNCESASVMGCDVVRSKGAGIYISNAFPVDSAHIAGNNYTDTGNQSIGIDPVWSGQVAAPSWDGTTLTATPGNTVQIWTGVRDGIPSVNGTGGLYAPLERYTKSLKWEPEVTPRVVVARGGTKNLEFTGGTYHGFLNGYLDTIEIPAIAPISFRHVRSDGHKYPVVTDVDNANTEETPGAIGAASGNAQSMKFFLDVEKQEFFLQYGGVSYSSVTTTGVYQGFYENTADYPGNYTYLGRLVVNTSSANFDAASAAQWIPA